MRVWLSIVVALLSLALVGVSSAQPSATKPVVRALRGSTTGIQGAGFGPSERIAVTLFVLGRMREMKRVVASRQGSFVVRFVYEMPACTPWLVRAVGSVSGRVWYRSPVRECSPSNPAPVIQRQ